MIDFNKKGSVTFSQQDANENFLKIRYALERSVDLLNEEKRNSVIIRLADVILENMNFILAENKKDIEKISTDHWFYDRLLLNESRILDISKSLIELTKFSCDLYSEIDSYVMPNKLIIKKVKVPIGVVGIIYESRPNITIDVFAICFKSGNGCALKGGKEAENTNKIFVELIHQTLSEFNLPKEIVYLMPHDQNSTLFLINAVGIIDVCIPRGGRSLINFVRDNSNVPVIETGAGVVHVYFDLYGDINKCKDIVLNSKTRRISTCNTMDILIFHEDRLNEIRYILEPLLKFNVKVLADEKSYNILEGWYPNESLGRANEDDFQKEFLSYTMAIKTIDSVENATNHINKYGSKHTDVIITENGKNAEYFTKYVDSAVVIINAASVFSDGGEFGKGCEIGISTQKLHARGPMAMDELTTYKWIVIGDGQIRP